MVQYNVMLGMSWHNIVDMWIACKYGDEIHGKNYNNNSFQIKCKRALQKLPS